MLVMCLSFRQAKGAKGKQSEQHSTFLSMVLQRLDPNWSSSSSNRRRRREEARNPLVFPRILFQTKQNNSSTGGGDEGTQDF